MKKHSLLAAVALFGALSALELAAVRHTIRNHSETGITAELRYNGCDVDSRGISPENHPFLVSERDNNCLLESVKITPNNTTYGFQTIEFQRGRDYTLHPGEDTEWSYTGTSLSRY